MINSPGAGCINLKGTSVTNSPPKVPQFSLQRREYEIIIPMESTFLPSLVKVDEARLTSSSCKFKCVHCGIIKFQAYLQVPIKRDPVAVLVAGGKRHQIELLSEGRTRSYRAAFSGFQASNMLRKLGIHHGHFAMLDDIALQKIIRSKGMEENSKTP